MKLYFYNKSEGHNSTDTDRMILKSLESHCGKPQSAFKVIRSADGKPFIENSEYHVGVSHTNTLVVIAVDTVNFGIDCESTSRCVKSKERIAKKYYSAKEQEYVLEDGLTDCEISERFLEIWVKKEAYVKYLGTGVKDMKNCDTFSLKGSFEKVNYGNNIIYIYKE